MAIDWKNVKNDTKLRVVFYGRVSTEHEMQKDAFNNQIQWYYDQLEHHPEWILAKPIETYLDRGITGTQAKKRPGFMKMIADAEKGIFDMVVTREVSRFGRNTVDTLEYSRLLKEKDVQIYFVNDGIRTLQDNDGEFRLTIMASLAQAESGKISDRVKAGQYISRQNGVLYGSGNVLGYTRIRKARDDDKKGHIKDSEVPTFAIDPKQAETVRMIFNLYDQGLGLKRIRTSLLQEKRKNATGEVSWHESTISRILENPMYIGKQWQHKTEVTNYLTGKKKTIAKEDRVLIDGDFEPIISEELFERVQKKKADKQKERPESKFGKGGYETSDKWVDKLECGCGSRYRKYNWRTNKDGSVSRGYACRNRTINGSMEFRQKRGLEVPDDEELREFLEEYDVTDETGAPVQLDTGDICSMKGIPAWHLELMAKKVFTYITGAHRDEILRTFEEIAKGYLTETEQQTVDTEKLRKKINQQQDKLDRLLDLYTDGEISKEKYMEKRRPLMDSLEEMKGQLYQAENSESENGGQNDDLKEALEKIRQMADFSQGIDPDFLKRHVDKIIVRSDHCYEWMVNIHGDGVAFIEDNHMIAAAKLSEKRKYSLELQQTKYGSRFTDFINFDEAKEYRKEQGTYLRSNQWEDILLVVYVRN